MAPDPQHHGDDAGRTLQPGRHRRREVGSTRSRRGGDVDRTGVEVHRGVEGPQHRARSRVRPRPIGRVRSRRHTCPRRRCRGDDPRSGVDAPSLGARRALRPRRTRRRGGGDRHHHQIGVDHRPVEAGPGNVGPPHLATGVIERPDGAARRRHHHPGVGRRGGRAVVQVHRPPVGRGNRRARGGHGADDVACEHAAAASTRNAIRAASPVAPGGLDERDAAARARPRRTYRSSGRAADGPRARARRRQSVGVLRDVLVRVEQEAGFDDRALPASSNDAWSPGTVVSKTEPIVLRSTPSGSGAASSCRMNSESAARSRTAALCRSGTRAPGAGPRRARRGRLRLAHGTHEGRRGRTLQRRRERHDRAERGERRVVRPVEQFGTASVTTPPCECASRSTSLPGSRRCASRNCSAAPGRLDERRVRGVLPVRAAVRTVQEVRDFVGAVAEPLTARPTELPSDFVALRSRRRP